MAPALRRIPRLLAISPPVEASSWVDRAPELVAAGADGLLLRVFDDAPIEGWVERLLATGATVVLHAACGAYRGVGLHLPDGAPIPEHRGLVGISAHDAAGLQVDADYALLAPVFAPRSKPTSRPPLGLDGLRALIAGARMPVLALGGITPGNAAACVAAGAHGVAGIGSFADPASVAAIAAQLPVDGLAVPEEAP